MKSLNTTENLTPNQELFSHKDIENVLFNNTLPVYKDTPFRGAYPKSPARGLVVSFRIDSSAGVRSTGVEALKQSIISMGTQKLQNPDDLLRLDTWMLSCLFESLILGGLKWREFIQNEMEKFCSTNTSIMNWQVVRHGGMNMIFDKKISYEQKLWVTFNSLNDTSRWMDIVKDVRESLLPWLDYKLWNTIKEKEKNTRTNVAYDAQRKQMIEGDLSDPEELLDIIK